MQNLQCADLTSKNYFPSWKDLPTERSVMNVLDDDGQPVMHWCFLGEIVSWDYTQGRLMIRTRDQSRNSAAVGFHGDPFKGEWFGNYLDQALLRPGSTIAILYPYKYDDMFGTPLYVKQDDPKRAKVCLVDETAVEILTL